MEEKKKHKVVIGIEVVLLCMIIAIVGTNAASSNPPSNGVSYSKNSQTTVEGALNDLYTKANYGNASASQILKGKTALVGGEKVEGTMTNRGAVTGTVKPGDSYIIQAGYHNGSGKVTCESVTLSISFLGLGDYIRYTPSNMSFTAEWANNRNANAIKLNPSEINLWRVIRKNSNGTVDIVSEYVSSVEVGYTYFNRETYTERLNEIAKAYENPTYTIGSRHMGYNTSNEKYKTDVELVEISLGTLNSKKIGGEDNDGYWLARPGGSLGSEVPAVGGRCVDGWCYQALASWGSLSVRPIVVLKSTLKITGGNGTASSPYTLGV